MNLSSNSHSSTKATRNFSSASDELNVWYAYAILSPKASHLCLMSAKLHPWSKSRANTCIATQSFADMPPSRCAGTIVCPLLPFSSASSSSSICFQFLATLYLIFPISLLSGFQLYGTSSMLTCTFISLAPLSFYFFEFCNALYM